MNIPEEETKIQSNERAKWGWWKVKKRSCCILEFLFRKYGRPPKSEQAETEAQLNRIMDQNTYKNFAEVFSRDYACDILVKMMQQLDVGVQGNYLPPRLQVVCMRYITKALEQASMFQIISPETEWVLNKLCFPYFLMTDELIDLFDNEPEDYIRRDDIEDIEEVNDPVYDAETLVETFISNRGKTALPLLVNSIVAQLDEYNDTEDINARNYVVKDGCLRVLAVISKSLQSRKKPYYTQLEDMLVRHVFPEFESPVGFMRARACTTITKFLKISFQDEKNLEYICESVLKLLTDPSLPVQIEAAISVKKLLLLDKLDNIFIQYLPQILEQFLTIMNNIAEEYVVESLKWMVEKYSEHMAPYATQMIESLSNVFFQYLSEGEERDGFAATECLDTMLSLMTAITKHKEMFTPIEEYIVSVAKLVLTYDGRYYEFLTNTMECLCALTCYCDIRVEDDNGQLIDMDNDGSGACEIGKFSPLVWSLFPSIFSAWNKWAYSYIDDFYSTIDNYISRDPVTFLSSGAVPIEGTAEEYDDDKSIIKIQDYAQDGSGQVIEICCMNYLDMAQYLIKTTMTSDRSGAEDIKSVAVIIRSILHNCKDVTVPVYHPLNTERVEGLKVNADRAFPLLLLSPAMFLTNRDDIFSQQESLQKSLIECIASAIYYDPVKALSLLEENNLTNDIFTIWFALFKDPSKGNVNSSDTEEEDDQVFSSRFSKKQVALGLAAVLTIPIENLPSIIAENLPLLLSKLIRLMDSIVQYEAEHQNDEESNGDGGFQSAMYDSDDNDYDDWQGDYEEVEGEEEDEDFVDSEDVIDREGDEYIKMLYEMEKEENEKKAKAKASVKFSGGEIVSDPYNLYSDWWGSDEDDDDIFSALDGVDDIVYVATSIDDAFSRSGETLRSLIANFEASSYVPEGEILMKCKAVTEVARERLEKAN